MPFVVMLFEFGPLDEGSARLNDPAHIAARGQELARDMDRSIAGSRGTRSRQLPWLSEHNVPHHLVWLQICSCFVCIGGPQGASGIPLLGARAATRLRPYYTVAATQRPRILVIPAQCPDRRLTPVEKFGEGVHQVMRARHSAGLCCGSAGRRGRVRGRGPSSAPCDGHCKHPRMSASAACGGGECVSIAPSNPAGPIASAARDPKVGHHVPGRQPNDGGELRKATKGYRLKKPIDWVI